MDGVPIAATLRLLTGNNLDVWVGGMPEDGTEKLLSGNIARTRFTAMSSQPSNYNLLLALVFRASANLPKNTAFNVL